MLSRAFLDIVLSFRIILSALSFQSISERDPHSERLCFASSSQVVLLHIPDNQEEGYIQRTTETIKAGSMFRVIQLPLRRRTFGIHRQHAVQDTVA